MSTILIADDHEIVLEGMRMIFAKSGKNLEVCGEARNGEEAVEMARSLRPDIVVLDITMPRMNGLEAARLITASPVNCKILIFTMHELERLEDEVRQAGAHGFVLKSQAARDLVRAIETLLSGGTFFGVPGESEKSTQNSPQANPEKGNHFRVALAFV